MDEHGDPPRVTVTAAVIRRGDTVLLARRRPGKSYAGLWEFPGGKIEPGESHAECLARELAEELGIRVEVGEHIFTSRYRGPHGSIELHAYAVRHLGGAIQLTDHDAVAWAPLADLASYPVPPADEPVIAWLTRPPA